MTENSRELLNRIRLAAETICRHGWAEANAGNLSLQIDQTLAEELSATTCQHPNSTWFLVSRTGARFRDMAQNPLDGLMVIACDAEECYFPSNARPTSEWPTHKLIQMQQMHAGYSCLLHCHTTEIIALCHTDLVKDIQLLNETLAKLLPELSIYLPQGIAFSPYAPPGSIELAQSSLEHFRNCQALIWDRHGLLIRAKDIDAALDLMEVVNKAAKIYLMLHPSA